MAVEIFFFNFVENTILIRVAVFEDNKHLRETFELLLNKTEGLACTGAYPDSDGIIELLGYEPADIILMDIEMPGMNGIEATRLVKQHYPDIKILIQTVFFDDDYIFNAICAGASGYILKSTTPEGYVQAIQDVAAGHSPITPGIASRVLELFRKAVPAPAGPEIYTLTTQEKKVLELLVDGKSYKMISAGLGISFETVKSHIKNIYTKLHVNSGTEAVALALRKGIVER